MSELKTYTGSCHCGKVRYEVAMDLDKVMSCNCSMCSRMGWLLSFVPVAQFKLLSGEDVLVDYQFNTKRVHHKFCSTCGIRSFVHGQSRTGDELRGINVRCLEGVDLDALEVQKVDGKSF